MRQKENGGDQKKKKRTCKLKDTVIEITLSEQQRKNKMKEQK